ncbi:hypothetical protein K488DRAFT_75578 [Vararia minispora EC-137]|uniref:Uncharacterized protein n=1 Tax=Vararia minispora EC-137 TaxID=1314806 RepID=A0ACB8QYS6_9AGAM|nr:hypothetical protein K488DRAFT_75578 [Vararia minispora EC-137]
MTGISAALADESGGDPTARWAGVARILGPRWVQLPNLTLGLLGVQLLWSVEMSYASPYLISLGIPKSLMAVVFTAGPLSGLIVQPVVGILADASTSRFGRRRPYILYGAILTATALLLLGFTRPVAGIVTSIPSSANDMLTIWLAVLSVFCVDFSINVVQAMDRALIVDTLPSSQQPVGNAWAARMTALGSVGGFFFGGVDLTTVFPFLGKTEIEVLSVLASLLLIGTHIVTVCSVKEKILLSRKSNSFINEVKSLWHTFHSLPYVILQIVSTRLNTAWLGWFPVLFYTSLYVGDLYRRSVPVDTALSDTYIDAEANRLGSRAMLYSALLTLATNFLAPILVSEKRSERGSSEGRSRKPWFRRRMHLATLWAISHAVFAACMFGTFLTNNVTGATILMTITGFPWAIALWAPSSLLAEAILTSPHPSVDPLDDTQTILLADHRTPLHSREEIFAIADNDDNHEDDDSTAKPLPRPREPEWSDDDVDDESVPAAAQGLTGLLSNSDARQSWVNVGDAGDIASRTTDADDPDDAAPRSELSAKAGIILGIHNMFVVIPQFLVTGLASIIFAILEPTRSVVHHGGPVHAPATTTIDGGASADDAGDVVVALLRRDDGVAVAPRGPNAVAIIFRLGGLAAVVAFIVCWRLAEFLRRHG